MEVLMSWLSCACSCAFPCLSFACRESLKKRATGVPQNPWRGLWQSPGFSASAVSLDFRAVSCVQL